MNAGPFLPFILSNKKGIQTSEILTETRNLWDSFTKVRQDPFNLFKMEFLIPVWTIHRYLEKL